MHAHFGKKAQKLLAVEQLSPIVCKVMGHNPGPFTLQGSNTYVVGSGAERILVDTAEGKKEYITELGKMLEKENAKITQVILTHWHPDHVGGLTDVVKAPFCKNPRIYKMPEPNHDEAVFRRLSDFSTPETTNLIDRIRSIEHGDRFRTKGATLLAIHTPGHTKDHMCMLVEEDNSLVTGDIILGTGSSHFSNLVEYMDTLYTLLGLAKRLGGLSLLPSHGPIIPREKGIAKIEEYIHHREQRDVQILEVLTAAGAGVQTTAMQIVAKLYQDVPKHLHKAAETNVILHLLRLESQGKVAAHRAPSSAKADPYSLGGSTPPAELLDIFDAVAPNLSAKWALVAKSEL
eukprot:TRINITY_DN13521_c0_g1_i1.p1 TRINITY_DN13521_c0_g1~~TRINITY_DN13521_c0_g1_i1.p1  ORF type:complete len:362 (+),score=168.08 TRINITY_DN13521_c0_g1_i1:50-1087(+)